MHGWLLVATCLLAGAVLRRRGFTPEATAGLNRYVLVLAVPALALQAIPRLDLDASLLRAALGPWVVFAAALVVWPMVGPRFGWSSRTIGCLILVTGLGNTAFVGYPIVRSLYGEAGLRVAVLVDQVGSFLAFSTAGVWVAQRYGPRSGSPRRVWAFPPFVALCVGLLGHAAPPLGQILRAASPVLEPIAGSLVPVALVSVGTQIPQRWPRLSAALGLGLAQKMVVAPAVVAALLWPFQPWTLTEQVTIVQCGMPPMVTAAILATEHDLDAELGAELIGYGIPVALGTTWLTQLWLG
jgi:hypothetical protein